MLPEPEPMPDVLPSVDRLLALFVLESGIRPDPPRVASSPVLGASGTL